MKISKKLTNFIKAIFIIAVFSISLITASKILTLKSLDGYEQMQAFYKQKENTVDVLFLGSSKVFCQIDTGILWDQHGMSAFDLGGAEAPPWNSYFYLKEALKTQNPKVIIYDASIIGFRNEVMFTPESWTIINNYGMKWNENRINQLLVNTDGKKQFKSLLFPLNTMHSRYKELVTNDFNDFKNSINFKGFDYRNTTVPFETPDMTNVLEFDPIGEKHEKYLKMIIDLARENNIPIVVMISPYVVSEQEERYFNTVGLICKENNVEFFDFNRMYDAIGLDFATDMAEDIHVNLSGSKKFTEYLGNYIKNNYEIEDHRGDEKYSSWDFDADANRRIREYEAELWSSINVEQ